MYRQQPKADEFRQQIRATMRRTDMRQPYQSKDADKLRDALEAQTFDVGDREPFVQWIQEWAIDDHLNDLGGF
jgi:cysteinyl-tRNA synthetase